MIIQDTKKRKLEVDGIIILNEAPLAVRNRYPIGRVIALTKRKDGLNRSASIFLPAVEGRKERTNVRDIQNMSLLDISEEDNVQL